MFKVIAVCEIGIGDWEYTSGDKHCALLALSKDVEIPFPPFPSLSLSSKNWTPNQIEAVRFDIYKEVFICKTKVDDEIPDTIKAMEDAGKSRKEITTWQLDKLDQKIEFYVDFVGWTLDGKRLEMYTRWVNTLRESLY